MTLIDRVAILHPSLNSAGGGEQVTLQIIKSLQTREKDIVLGTVEKTDWEYLEKVFGKISKPDKEFYCFSKLPKTRIQFLDSTIIVSLFITLILYFRIFREEIQINTCGEKVNSISDIIYFNAIPLRSAYKLENTSTPRRILSRIYNLVMFPLDFINRGNILLANSHFNKNLIKNTIRRESSVLYPPINLDKIKSDKITKYDCVTVASRYLPEQSLEMIPSLAAKLKGVKFKLIGTATPDSMKTIAKLRKTCMELGVSDRVEIMYNQPFEKYVSTLYASKIFLRPLPSEPFGISIIEAMQAGCVPLVRRGSGPWMDILEEKDGKYGFVFSETDEAAIKICRVICDMELLERLQNRIQSKITYFQSMNFDTGISEIVNSFNSGKIGSM